MRTRAATPHAHLHGGPRPAARLQGATEEGGSQQQRRGWPGPAPGAARPRAPRLTLAILVLSQLSSLTAVWVRGGGPESPRSRAIRRSCPQSTRGSTERQAGRQASSGAPGPALRAQEAGAHTGVRPPAPQAGPGPQSGDPPPLLVCSPFRSPTASSPGSLPRQHSQAAACQGQVTCPKDPGSEPVAGEPAPAGQPGGAGTSSQPSALGMPASAVRDSAGGRGTGVCT